MLHFTPPWSKKLPTFFLTSLCSLPLTGIAETLVTKTHTIELTSQCRENTHSCDNVIYKGISKRSGKTLKLKGRTIHEDCDEDECALTGYSFNNGNTQYLVSIDGKLTVSQGINLILEQQGVWDFSRIKEGDVKASAFPLLYSPDGRTKITIKQNKKSKVITARLPNGSQQVLLDSTDGKGISEEVLFVAVFEDYNVDGMKDIAFPDVGFSGYSGVNLPYYIFLWNPNQQRFTELTHTNKAEEGSKILINPTVDSTNKILSEIYRDGPFTHQDFYQFTKNQPYTVTPTKTSVFLDDGLYQVTLINPKTQQKSSIITPVEPDKVNSETPAITRKVSKKTALYSKHETPFKWVKTKMYLINGDEVELLDFDSYGDFYLVRFHGKKVIQKWIPTNAFH